MKQRCSARGYKLGVPQVFLEAAFDLFRDYLHNVVEFVLDLDETGMNESRS
jgi:hypothetical protein